MAAMLAATMAQIAGPGVPRFGLTRRKNAENGVPLSRARANTPRDADVTQASPQNHIAMEASAAIAFPNLAPSACCKIAIAAGTVLLLASFAEYTPGNYWKSRVSAVRCVDSYNRDTA